MKPNNLKIKWQFLTFAFFFLYPDTFFAQNFYTKNFRDLYTVSKTEKDSFVGIINERYLNLKDFHAINDSVFATQNKTEMLVFHFKLNNPEFYEVSIEYFVDNHLKINKFLERIGEKTTKALQDFKQNNSGFLEESDEKKRRYASILVEKDKTFLDKKLNKIQFTFKKNFIDSDEKPYKWRKSEHQLSRAYPLQNSVWYFDAKTLTEEKVNDRENNRITTTIYCSKTPKYPHKIEFLDDENYVVTYNNGKETKTLNGSYRTNATEIHSTDNQLIDVEFEIDPEFRETPEPIATKVVKQKGIPEEIKKPENISFKEITDYEIGSWNYFCKMFSFSYQLNNTENKDIILTHIDLIGGNYIAPVEIGPAQAPQKSKK